MKLYLKFLSIHFRSAMTYRSSFFLSCLGQVLITTNVFLSVVFLMERFDSIGGYTLPQLSLCYSVILAGTSLAECFARGFDIFHRLLSDASFDRIMVRPRPLLFQVLCQDMKPTMFARVLQAAVMLVWAIGSGAVRWTPAKALVLALMIACGAAIFFGLFLINACICFFTLEHIETLNIFTDGPREYGKYPFGVYGKPVLLILTFLVPLALVQHWPLQYLFDRGPWWYGLLPLAALLFLIPCGLLWRLGVQHYKSTGS
ncbi:MAG: ABC-2 family transporter protein [Oscillospiraceae bacterium]|nr:ABC-2 family transporter protein [Oscillospiraceae bacterium]MBP3521024.1 ABC-2 family transporter protein [Oscillospiraceae bacterium]